MADNVAMFAYGSNLNIEQMAKRCPRAEPLYALELLNWRLVFRGVADCVPADGFVCYGGIWRITPECERVLDIYEGVKAGMYYKEYLHIKPLEEGIDTLMVYCMNSTGIMPPSQLYLNVIKQGYRDFHLKKDAFTVLNNAVRASWDDRAPTHIERKRLRRTGRPPFTSRPEVQ